MIEVKLVQGEKYLEKETINMTDTQNQSNNDKIAALTKEAENLKLKLEEERQKLNDVTRKLENLCHTMNPTYSLRPRTFCFHCFSVIGCGTFGNDNVHKYQAATCVERTSGKSAVFRLVAR